MGENHVEFSVFKHFEFASSNFFLLGCDVLDPDDLVNVIDISSNDSSSFHYTLFECYGLHRITVDSLTLSIVEDEPYVIDGGYLSDWCRFTIILTCMPPRSGGDELDMDVEIKFEARPSDGAHPRMIVYMDNALWRFFMLMKDPNPESLRWFLLLQEFEFEVCHKG